MSNDYTPIDGSGSGRSLRARKNWIFSALAVLVALSIFGATRIAHNASEKPTEPLICDSVRKLDQFPVQKIQKLLGDQKLYNETLVKLQNSVRIPTELFDLSVNPEEDPDHETWDSFKKLHKQLIKDFPTVWEKLEIEYVNHYGFIITWPGSNSKLKPIMFAAHQDVVPVERKTWDQWEHEPFSGDVTQDPEWGTTLWGRGSFDDKNQLIGILQALEYLLVNEPKFKPQRSIILASGFDEESGGQLGAAYIAKNLLERYGEDGILSIIDEGVVGVREVDNVLMAAPGTAEKGRLDMWIHLNTPGGHSSVPPDHTSIGIAAELITDIESEKFPALFTERNPVSQYYRCIAKNSDTMSPSVKKDFARSMQDPEARGRVLKYLFETGGKKVEYLFRSTHAFDMIHGGIKSNALPETVSVFVDSRVAVETPIEEIKEAFIAKIMKVAKKYNLGVSTADQELRAATANGEFVIEISEPLESAPVSPENEVWSVFAGVIKTFYEDAVFPESRYDSRELVVAPSIMSANTDTAHYWKLTKNIYRYQPGFAMEDTLSTIHSVNEHINFETVMHVVAFTYGYIHAIEATEL
ncbi:LAFA_0A06634g1_1 [Lachancea sp. 'fantastica']|nr:LAFA_0A06634g1_1 [Lachancea sp. 'fantastica']